MLNQILTEIENAQTGINIHELSHKLGVDSSALTGMIEFLVQKGKLALEGTEDDAGAPSCDCACSGTSGCAYVPQMPNSFTLLK